MSENNSRSYTQIAAIILALCIPAVPVIGTVLTPDKYPGSAYKDYSNRCTECLTIADSGKDQQKRYCKPEQPDWCGLAAQYRSAVAAESTSFWTAVMSAITGIGVFLLWFTLRETRTVTQVTRDIGRKQVRAYLSAEITNPDMRAHLDDDAIIIHSAVSVKNHGSSPARNIKARAIFFFADEPVNTAGDHILITDILAPQNADVADISQQIRTGKNIRTLGVPAYFTVLVLIEYDDVFKDSHTDEFFFYLWNGNSAARKTLNNVRLDSGLRGEDLPRMEWRRDDKKRREESHGRLRDRGLLTSPEC